MSIVADRHRERSLQADFLVRLYEGGLPLGEDRLSVVRSRKGGVLPHERQEEDAIQQSVEEHHLTIEEYLSRFPRHLIAKWRDKEIGYRDWAPQGIEQHTDDFRAFISSHIPRFDLLVPYEPFYLYLEQARRWMAETEGMADQKSRREKLEFGAREYERCRTNYLYALDRYVWIKEGQMEGGRRKYIASCPQAFLLYIMNCKYSFIMGKGRHAAITSTICPALMMQAITNRSQHILLMAGSDEQVQNIFEDKIRYTFGELPQWFRPAALYSRKGKGIQFGDEEGEKGTKTAHGSKFNVKPPSVTAVNSGSPDVVAIDEASDAPDFTKMMFEADPTQIGLSGGTLKAMRVMMAWSTGVPNGKSKGEFERDLRTLVDKWRSGQSGRFIPLFFNWTCRPGVRAEDREAARRRFDTGGSSAQNEASREERLAQWRMHWPRDLDDMFSVSHKTIIPVSAIRAYTDRMDADFARSPMLRPKKGWFEPVLDRSKPMPEGSYYPYKCKGATFRPAPDDEDAPVYMFLPYEAGWTNRYWQGTDPLINNTGTSKMSSAIWDSRDNDDTTNIYPTLACFVNHRDPRNIDLSYEQCALMNIHYGGCPDLIESNMGKGYIAFKQSPCLLLDHTFVWNKELPDVLQTGRNQRIDHIGIDNHAERKEYIISQYMKMMFNLYGQNFKFPELWAQVRTFALSITDSGNERWKTVDYRIHQDDMLFAATFAYICRQAFPHRVTQKIDVAEQKYRIEHIWKFDHNGIKQRVETRVPMYAA